MPEYDDLRAPVYPTPWQPIMLKGVPRDWGMFALIASALVAMLAGYAGVRWFQVVGIGAGLVLWFVGWLAAKFDPEFFSITLTRLQIGKSKSGKDGNEYLA